MNISIVVKIQKLFRSYSACKKICILSAAYQTKKWRQTQKWYNNGRSTECEKYQKDIVEKIILKKINLTEKQLSNIEELVEFFDRKNYNKLKEEIKEEDAELRNTAQLLNLFNMSKAEIMENIKEDVKNVYNKKVKLKEMQKKQEESEKKFNSLYNILKDYVDDES